MAATKFDKPLSTEVQALADQIVTNNGADQTIKNSTAGGNTILRVKSDAATNAEALIKADSEGGNLQVKKGNSIAEMDSNGLKDDGTGYARIYTTANGSNVKTFQFKQNGDFITGMGIQIGSNTTNEGVALKKISWSTSLTVPLENAHFCIFVNGDDMFSCVVTGGTTLHTFHISGTSHPSITYDSTNKQVTIEYESAGLQYAIYG